MGFKIMPKAALPEWVEQLQAGHRVVGPQPQHGQYIFGDIKDPEDIHLDYPTSVLPPKQFILPPREELLQYKNGGLYIHANTEERTPTVVMGVHTCDMHAIQLLDRVHSTGYPDQHYQARRENTTLVSIECLRPCMEHSFCKSMGTLTVTEEFDIHLTDLGNDYAVDIGSEKGERLLEGFASLWDPTDADYKRINKVLSEKWPRFSYRLNFDITELPDILNLSLGSALWDELGERCLACGMCTKVCPTCYCFNVVDEIDLSLQDGKRMRVWDSCQVHEFAMVAGGHNFRENRALRQRHRFLRKGKYQYEAYGLVGCVGCGRCAMSCLVHITPVDTFNDLYERRRAKGKVQETQA
ncbi:MAG: 4Fe-4S dicluster domain-containing protein [Anaerolineae bacterium]|nr:4Fe-4S dicluster domain-containing protein [Anaerolineae bacterium]